MTNNDAEINSAKIKTKNMLTFGFLFTCIGAILILFNTVTLSFVKDQVKNKKQALAGYISLVMGLVLLVIAIKNLMQVE